MNALDNMLQNHIGRKELYTDVERVTAENILKVMQENAPYFTVNAQDCQKLIDFESGIQPLQRKEPKKFRPDIDFECCDNVAAEVTQFNLGFKWGYPITLVQRGELDSGNDAEVEAISKLNEMYFADGINAKTQQLGRFTEVTGIGYTIVEMNLDADLDEGESLFKVSVLDPRTTFVIRSSRYVDRRVMVAGTFREDNSGNILFTCFTPEQRFEILNGYSIVNGKKSTERDLWAEGNRSGEANPLGVIPIVEWFLSYDRQGCFERQISAMNTLNLMLSDLANDIDQNTQCVWHTNDVDFVDEENADGTVSTSTPKSGDWVQTYTSPDGKTPFIKPLTLDYDYNGMLQNYLTQRGLVLQKCNVPQRNDNSGGSTGIAMDTASGWSAAEAVACAQQNIIETCKLQEVRIVLRAIKRNPKTPSDSPLLKLRAMDIKPTVRRQKSYELAVKTSSLSSMIASGIYGKHAIDTVNLFDDPNQVWADSESLIAKHQDKLFGAEERIEEIAKSENITSDNPIAQITNSPLIDGMSREKPIEE